MVQPHSKLLDLAAKRHLVPLGLTRKGRSRTWLDDQRWYAIVVEFQPSGHTKGSYVLEASPLFTRLGNLPNPHPWQTDLAKLCLDLQRVLAQPAELRAVVNRMIKQQRCALRLPEIDQPLT